ncbi:MAG: hypothetical protein K1X72_28920 [Pyrinomonadaceae bacterium]|nr:hypothetical protein [Pyrinomonadaceae bacterium]
MRKVYYNFLLIAGLMVIFSLTTSVLADDKKDTKRPKNTGILTVKTTPASYPVLVDGVQVGMSGVGQEAEFYLTPGTHKIEVLGPDGKIWSKEIVTEKDRKTCVCLKMVETEIRKNCPYNISVSGPDRVEDGAVATFIAMNTPPNNAAPSYPLNYVWTVTPSTARITSGLGTNTITVDSTGLGNQRITASVEVTDGYYDAQCRQRNSVPTDITPLPPKEREYELMDYFTFKVFDDTKARLDNYVSSIQAKPNGSGYIIFYQGTEKKAPDANKISRRVLDYLVKVRGMDPSRLQIIQGGTRPQTRIELYVIYPGGKIPIPSQE